MRSPEPPVRPSATPYTDILLADWPTVTVVIPLHNESSWPATFWMRSSTPIPPRETADLAVNDRSEDETGAIIDSYAARHPDWCFHFIGGRHARKAAALKAAGCAVTTEIQLVFDADYTPVQV